MKLNQPAPLGLLLGLALGVLALASCNRQPSGQVSDGERPAVAGQSKMDRVSPDEFVIKSSPKVPEEVGQDGSDQSDKLESGAMQLKRELLALKRQDGRDNAIIHYLDASQIVKNISDLADQSDSIKQVLNDGWSNKAENLLPFLAQCQPAFSEIRKGAELDYARNIGSKIGPATPVLNFLAIQTFAKMLCVEGRHLESQGKYDAALADYLTVLTMGRDAGAQGATLECSLLSMSCIHFASIQIGRLAASGHLDRPALTRLNTRLMQIENTLEPISHAFIIEKEICLIECEKWKNDPRMTLSIMFPSELDGSNLDGNDKKVANDMIDHLISSRNLLWGYVIRNLDTPYWKRDAKIYQAGYDAILANVSPLVKEMTSAVADIAIDTDTRNHIAHVSLQKAILSSALALYKLEKGQYPATLDPLVPTYLKSTVLDPFTGKPYEYRPSPDNSAYQLGSAGPDGKNDSARITYDPSNGTTSTGDIY